MRAASLRDSLAIAAILAALLGAASIATSARATEDSAPAVEDDADDDEHVLRIPGFGPIPLPPGARVMRPRPAPPAEPKAASPPEPPASPEQRRAHSLDDLLARLAAAEDEQEAQAIAVSLQRVWARSGSDTIDLLIDRAALAETAGAIHAARELLDSVVLLEPAFAEGLVRRARVETALGDLSGAAADLERAVRLEPRRFDAFSALGAAAESLGEKKRALEAYRRSLAIDPRQDGLRKTEERLRLEVEGRDI
jgi:tetratricopeptide (TPR) repeat protein